MVCFIYSVGGEIYCFDSFKDVMVKVSFVCFGDFFVGVVVSNDGEWVVVQMVLVDILFKYFFDEVLIFYEDDEVICLIIDIYQCDVFVLVFYFIVGGFCDWLFGDVVDEVSLCVLVLGLMLEMVVVVLKIMCVQDLVLVVQKICVVICFCNIFGFCGWFFICL